MVSFENFVKSMPPSLSELKVTPSFCFPFKIPDHPTATTIESVFIVLGIHNFVPRFEPNYSFQKFVKLNWVMKN